MSYAVNPTIFRAYDIRGVVDVDLSEAVYQTLGRAAGSYFRGRSSAAERPRIVVGRDARLTSPAYAAALIGGLRSTGIVRVTLDGERVTSEERISLGQRIRDVRQGPDGLVYALVDDSNGVLLRLSPAGR